MPSSTTIGPSSSCTWPSANRRRSTWPGRSPPTWCRRRRRALPPRPGRTGERMGSANPRVTCVKRRLGWAAALFVALAGTPAACPAGGPRVTLSFEPVGDTAVTPHPGPPPQGGKGKEGAPPAAPPVVPPPCAVYAIDLETALGLAGAE